MTLPSVIADIIALNPPKFTVSCIKPRQILSVFPFAGYDLIETPDLLTRESYLLSSIETYQRKRIADYASELFNKCKDFVKTNNLKTSASAIVSFITSPDNVQVVSKLSEGDNKGILKSEETVIAEWLTGNKDYLKEFFGRFVSLQEQVIIWRVSLLTWSRSEGAFILENELGNLTDAEFTELNNWVDGQITKPEDIELTDEEVEEQEETGKA